MQTREHLLKVSLTESEVELLKANANNCGLTISAFLRTIIKGYQPRPSPPKEFWKLMDQLYFIHDCLKKIANSNTEISNSAKLHQTEILNFILKLQVAVTLPERTVMQYGDN